MLRLRVKAAAVCAVVLLPLTASQAGAADPPAHLGEGVLVPGRTAVDVGLSGSRVVVSNPVYETSDNGTTWTASGGSNDGKPLQVEGPSLLTFDAGTAKVGGLTFPAADEVVLGKGGKLVSHRAASAATAAVYDVTSKTKVADVAPPFALSGDTVWKVTQPGHLDAKNLTTGVVKTVLVASACSVGAGGVNGRWAVLSGCNQVVDVNGPQPPRNLTVAADSQLGNGFAVQTSGSACW